MAQGVQASGGGDAPGQARAELRVHDAQAHGAAHAGDIGLDVLLRIGDGAAGGALTAGARRGGDHDEGHAGLRHHTGAAEILPQGGRIGLQHLSALGGIQGAAAPDAHHAVDAFLHAQGSGFLHRPNRGIGLHIVVNDDLDTRVPDGLQHLFRDARLLHALVKDGQHLFAAQLLKLQAGPRRGADAEEDGVWTVENTLHSVLPVIHHKIFLYLLYPIFP